MIVSGLFVHLKDSTVKFNVIFIVILLAWLAFSSMQYLPWQTQEVDVARHDNKNHPRRHDRNADCLNGEVEEVPWCQKPALGHHVEDYAHEKESANHPE